MGFSTHHFLGGPLASTTYVLQRPALQPSSILREFITCFVLRCCILLFWMTFGLEFRFGRTIEILQGPVRCNLGKVSLPWIDMEYPMVIRYKDDNGMSYSLMGILVGTIIRPRNRSYQNFVWFVPWVQPDSSVMTDDC